MRVLVVDDDPGTRAIVKRVTSKALKCSTDEAANGLEGLELLERRKYALVVLDWQMPVLGGFDTLAAIRKAPALSDLPVVMLTGDASEDLVRQAATLGVAAYLAKPIDPPRLTARLLQIADAMIPEVRDASRPGVSVVLVCDTDPAFRRKAAGMLGSNWIVRESDSGVEMLRLLSDEHNAASVHAVLCGAQTGVVHPDMLVRQAKQLPAGQHITMCTALPKEAMADARRLGLWDGVMSETLPPDMFASQFARVVTSTAEARRARAAAAARPAPALRVAPPPAARPRDEEEGGVLVIG
ncbi:MAG: response regulator [Acidobacteria bacterium]|nr:response regulator [Acidobacteriota bacterium]